LTELIDKILELTPTWIHVNALFLQLDCNKALFLKTYKKMVDDDYLELDEIGRKKFLKNNYKGDTETKFSSIMAVMVWNQNVELDKIKELSTIGYLTLTNNGLELLDHIQDQVDRAYMVMVRMNYQSKLRVITQRVVDERTKRLQDHIDKIMTALTSKFNNDLIKNYFQNHLTRLEFKI
jgi:hypothetical protein